MTCKGKSKLTHLKVGNSPTIVSVRFLALLLLRFVVLISPTLTFNHISAQGYTLKH